MRLRSEAVVNHRQAQGRGEEALLWETEVRGAAVRSPLGQAGLSVEASHWLGCCRAGRNSSSCFWLEARLVPLCGDIQWG